MSNLPQNPTTEIQAMRDACTSFATAKGSAAERRERAVNSGILDCVPALGENTSRGAMIVRMFSLLTWGITLRMTTGVPHKIALALTEAGCTVDNMARTIVIPNEDGNPWLPKVVRDALAQLDALGVKATHMSHTVDVDDLGYSGVRTLAIILDSTRELDSALGLAADWDHPTMVRLYNHKRGESCPGDVPTTVTFGASVESVRDVVALHRVIMAYVGRAAFTRDGGLNPFQRTASALSLAQHFTKGSASWCRIMTGDRGKHTIPGDALANDQLRAIVHRNTGFKLDTK